MQQLAIMEAEGAALRFQLEGDYSAEGIADAVEGLIELLDKRFAPFDPDEPDFRSISDGLPGDPAEAEPDEGEEAGAYVEWHTKTTQQRKLGVEIAPNGGHLGFGSHEDDEEDDPAGQCDEDGINTYLWAQWGRGAGCLISDNDREHDGSELEDFI